MLLSTELKLNNFAVSPLFINLTPKIFVFDFFKQKHTLVYHNNFLTSKNIIKNHVNRYPSQLMYDANLFDNNFNLFSMLLTNFSSSIEFAICSRIPSSGVSYHVETSLPICSTNSCTDVCMVEDFSGGYS